MDNNDTSISTVPRKTYSREILISLKNSELSNLWPKSLDKNCINNHNQWDPVKSFENAKTTDTKRNIFADNKTGYRNNDKTKDDISLRPERRPWNDGCQVTKNKRNGDENHASSYRKSYHSAVPNCGGGDYDRTRLNRNINRNNKIKDGENTKDAKLVVSCSKTDKSSRNNSNLEERKDEKDEQKILAKSGNNSRFNRNNEPEWFLDGPDNCEETIELRGITANDNEMLNFKACSKVDEVHKPNDNNLMLNLTMEKSALVENGISPKREGSRFQDIFLKEKQINNLNESKDVENILKAVLSDNVSKSDAERLNNVSKPLPNGVLTLEEIEKNMTSGPIMMDRATVASKSTTIDTMNSFETSLKSLFSSELSSPGQDNSKVVNWLSGLNVHGKDVEIDKKLPYNDGPHNFCNINPMMNQSIQMPANCSKFIPTLQPPPGLPLVLNNNHLQQHQQQQFQIMQQQNKLFQSTALMKQLQMPQSSNMNQNLQSRNILPCMFQPHNSSNEFDNFMNEKFKMNNAQNMANETHVDQNFISNYLLKNKVQINNINHDRNHLLTMNGPPGLTNLNLIEKNMIMQPRPIVKTSSPQIFENNMIEFKNFPNNFAYNRTLSANSNPFHMQNLDGNNTVQMNPMYNNLRNRDTLQKQAMLLNNCSYRQSFIPSAHEMNIQSSSSNKMLANLFNVSSSTLPPLPQQAKYADQIETENI